MTEGWSGGTSDFENTRQAKGIWVKSQNKNYNFIYLKNPQEDFWKIVSEILSDRDFPFILKIVIVCLDKKINKNHTFNRTNNSDLRNYNNQFPLSAGARKIVPLGLPPNYCLAFQAWGEKVGEKWV